MLKLVPVRVELRLHLADLAAVRGCNSHRHRRRSREEQQVHSPAGTTFDLVTSFLSKLSPTNL